MTMKKEVKSILLPVVGIIYSLLSVQQHQHTASGFVQVSNSRRHNNVSLTRTLSSQLFDAGKTTATASASTYYPPLNVAVVGAGPSGLLLSHLLLKQENVKITLVESRSDPRENNEKEKKDQRAYALGLGIRGRTAIRQVDEDLWKAVKSKGYESERFQLHIGGLVVTLRSEKDGGEGLEPSLLTFQSELCSALTEELARRHLPNGSDGGHNNLKLCFGAPADECNLEDMKITTTTGDAMGPFDLIVGCDGVNSPVRTAMESIHPSFASKKEFLPGEFKVVRLDQVPTKVDRTAVSLVLPKKGSTTAFVEPTGTDGSCCILFAGRGDDSSILKETKNITAVVEALQEAFPQWEDQVEAMAAQLTAQDVAGSASSIECNTYHFAGKAALAGDAAHATGGVSGQGVNSALMDSVVLANSIMENRDDISSALLSYSLKQVPEGKALYDLSFGPKPTGLKALEFVLKNARDAIFRGRFGVGEAPLQTKLTTSMESFAAIRRDRDRYYDKKFPDDEEFAETQTKIHREAVAASTETGKLTRQ